ncbi:MAG: NAD-binding protein, partial [Phycisphaerales bacterium]|nr:NAD-binding protein [Phycisphaerales bacterium]
MPARLRQPVVIGDVRAEHRVSRLWREWCFARAVFAHLRWRLLLLLGLLVIGGWLFRVLEPEQDLSVAESMYFTWSLIFGEPPEDFPENVILQSLFFIVPILGLTVIIEALIDLALMARDRRRYEPSWCRIMTRTLSDHVILVGLGRLGIRTYRLLREMGVAVVVIEKNAANQFLDEVRRDGAPLFVGDARDESYLEHAGVEKAMSIVVATSDDLANLECALDARRLAPGIRVVLRMFDQNMADKVREGFNISLAMSPAAISAPA